jgi:hypothetical protein
LEGEEIDRETRADVSEGYDNIVQNATSQPEKKREYTILSGQTQTRVYWVG